MSRYTGPVWRISRRLGYSILGSGKELQKRQTVPGQHGDARPKKKTEYGIQMTEKQKLRFTYGISEKQFQRLFRIAKSDRTKVTGTYFMQILESRLDNLVYRLGFAQTRRQARQLVTHGHVTVNGKKVDIPSYQVKAGDVIEVAESSRSSEIFKRLLGQDAPVFLIPAWMEREKNALKGTVTRLPAREDIDVPVEEHLIVELYSK